jgi:hypothetical protein
LLVVNDLAESDNRLMQVQDLLVYLILQLNEHVRGHIFQFSIFLPQRLNLSQQRPTLAKPRVSAEPIRSSNRRH